MKMKKALIPPITLMTSLMSGTNTAMRRVTAIQTTVRTTLQRLSNEWVTIPLRFLWTRRTRFRMTDLYHAHTAWQHVRWATINNTNPPWCFSPAQQKYDGIDSDNWNAKKQSGDDDGHIIPWIWHQNIRGHDSSKGQEAVHAWRWREDMRLAASTWEQDELGGGELTCQGVDEQTETHGDDRDGHPVGDLLVLHAAVDCYTRFMALQTHLTDCCTQTCMLVFTCTCKQIGSSQLHCCDCSDVSDGGTSVSGVQPCK